MKTSYLLTYLLTLALVFSAYFSTAQGNSECWTSISDTSDRSIYEWGTTCFFLDEFKINPNTVEKVVRVNFHVIQDENGNNNFQESDTALLRQKFETQVNNERYINNAQPSDPMPGVQEESTTKIRFRLMDIHFHQDPVYWDASNATGEHFSLTVLNKKFGVNLESEINVYFIEDTEYDICGGHISYMPTVFSSKYKQGVYMLNFYEDDPEHNFGAILAHELGHHLGLEHPFNGESASDCNSKSDDLEDTPCPDSGPRYNNDWCNPYDNPDDNCTNNLMAYSSEKTYHSPLQIAVMHYTLTATNASQYLTSSSYPPSGNIVVTNTVMWNNPKAINGDIIIKNGGSLTLNCALKLTADKKIIIEKGGELIIDGGSVTSFGVGRWFGIEVQGDPNLAQYPYSNQGYFEMISGLIANSIYGVYTYKEENNTYIPGYEGGIVRVLGQSFTKPARFYNNVYDITIYGNNLLEANSKSTIQYAYLAFFEDYNLDNVYTKQHISLYDEDKIEIENFRINSFYENEIPPYEDLSLGIYIQNTNTSIEFTSPSYIINMKYGIYAAFTDPTKSIDLKSTGGSLGIMDAICGIYLSGVSNASILSTTFRYNSNKYINYHNSGIYLDNSTGYHIEDNSFVNYSDIRAAGILVNSSGDELNALYRNYFTNMEIGIGAEGDNRGTTMSEGLKIKCNDFTNCEADIKVVPDLAGAGISRYQGNGNSVTGPAGNLFSKNNNSNPFSDFNNTNTYAPIVYVHHSGDPDNDDWVPKYYSASTIGLKDVGFGHPGFDNACPSNLDSRTKSELNTIVSSNQTLLNDADNQLNLIVDGGITSQLLNEVETSQPGEGYELQSQLLEESSNLSDDVMESSIQKEDVLNEAQLTEVLSANPQAAKSERIKLALDNRNNPLPDYMIEQINQGVSSMSLKEMVEADKSYYLQEMRQAQYNLLHKYKLEEEHYSIEDYIGELEGMDMPHAVYSRAFQQLKAGNISEAESIINTIPQEYNENQELLFDHEDYMEYFDLLKEMQLNNLRVEDLNTEQLAILEDLAYEIDNYSNVYARNMLNRFHGEHPMPSFAIFGDNNKVSKVSGKQNNKTAPNTLKVYPNPASHHVTVEIEGSYNDNTEVIIMDKLGRVQKSISFSGNVKAIQTQNLPAGTYIIQVIQGNQKYTEMITIE